MKSNVKLDRQNAQFWLWVFSCEKKFWHVGEEEKPVAHAVAAIWSSEAEHAACGVTIVTEPVMQPEYGPGHAMGGAHEPELQTWLLLVQSWHCVPLEPHCESMVPGKQLPAISQQVVHPLGHGGGGATHFWLMHVLPVVVQSWQAAPPAPQCGSLMPRRHVPVVSQHPFGQLCGSHAFAA